MLNKTEIHDQIVPTNVDNMYTYRVSKFDISKQVKLKFLNWNLYFLSRIIETGIETFSEYYLKVIITHAVL